MLLMAPFPTLYTLLEDPIWSAMAQKMLIRNIKIFGSCKYLKKIDQTHREILIIGGFRQKHILNWNLSTQYT